MTRDRKVPREQLAPFLLDVPHPRHLRPDQLPVAPPRLDWAALFGNAGPVEIEVGFGKGVFLVESAGLRPSTNFLGIEIEPLYAFSTAARLSKHGLTNVKVACTDARWFLKEYVRDGSVAVVHVYFPDPWWKQKHKKRKLFTRAFAEQVVRILEPEGRLSFATDVEAYFVETKALVADLMRELPTVGEPEVMTNFERKYRLEGRPIHRIQYAGKP